MGGVEMTLGHQPAVRNAIQIRLRPVPRCVEADGPPERAGAPEAEAEEATGEAGGEHAEGRLTRADPVTEYEGEGEEERGCPEARSIGMLRAEEQAIGSA